MSVSKSMPTPVDAAVLAGMDGDRSDLAELGYEWLTTQNAVVDGASAVQHTVRATSWGALTLDLVFNLVEGPKLPLPPAVTAVPEPEVFLLLCVGLLGFAGHARLSRAH